LTSNGTIQITGAGTIAQYVRGDGTLETFPSLTGFVPYTGATQNVDLGEFGVDAGFVTLDTTPTNTPTAQGTIFWDVDDETVDVVLNGYIMKIGEDQFYPVKNQTGSSIAKGTAVRFAGTVGASGRLLIAPFIADGSVSSSFFMGVTAEAIADGADGKVLYFGRIRGINTNAFNEGDVLYASTTVAGGFQTAVPLAPNNIVQVAAVINKSINQGVIFIRPSFGSNINQDEGVKIVSPTTGQLLQLQANGLWENKTTAQVLGGTSSQFVKGDGTLDSNTYQVTSEKGQPNGYASLDSNGKVPLVQINDALIGNVNFQGLWNASTNTPTLANPPASGTKGYYYIVSTAGTFAGISFEVGDWIISDGTAWGKVDNTDAVSSVFGRTGNVTAANGDYTTAQVTESGNLYYTDGRARGALSFVAGSGAYNSTTGVITIPTNNNQITNGAGYITSAALSGYVQGSGSAGQVAYWSSGSAITGESNLFWDSSNDRLGIGTSSPPSRLSVEYDKSTQFVGAALYDSQAFNSSNHGGAIGFGGTFNSAGNYTEWSSIGGMKSNTTDGNISGEINFYTRLNSSAMTERMRIFAEGQLHIGSTPSSNNGATLQVTGTAIISSNITGNSFIKSGGTSSQYLMADGSVSTLTNPITGTGDSNTLPKFTGSNTIGNSLFSDNGTNGGFGGTNYSSGTGLRSFNISAQDYPVLSFWANNQQTANISGLGFTGTLTLEADPSNIFADTKIVMSTDGTERLAIFNNGNVTIGNSPSDAGFKLDVNGTGRFSEKITSSVGNNAQILTTQGATTGYQFLDIVNTSGRLVIAQEGMTAGTVFIGTTAYASAIGTAVSRDFQIGTNNTIRLTIAAATGAATFSNIVTAQGRIISGPGAFRNGGFYIPSSNANTGSRTWAMTNDELEWGDFSIITSSTQTGDINTRRLYINSLGVTTINNLAGSGNRIVVANSSGTLISAVIGSGLAFDGTTLTATGGASGSISGSGTSGTIPVFTGGASIGNSVITQSGFNIGINTSTPNVIGFSGPMLTIAGTGQGQGIEIWRNSNSIPNDQDLGLITFLAGTSPKQVARIVGKAVGENEDAGALSFQTSTSAGGITDRLRITDNGNVLIGTTTSNGNLLRVNGTIFSDSSVTATSFFESSDATIKTLVEDAYQAKGIDSVVAKLYIKNGKQELGYYAQDLEGVLPSAVSKGSNGLLNLSYREVHTAKIAYLEQRIKQLENELVKPS
jgi:hypothetical protein